MTAEADRKATLPDARPRSLVLRLTPDFALPYVQLARLDRPAGWQFLLAPCWWSTALAGDAVHRGPDLAHLLLFLIGAIAMRGAGCTYNDILDRDLDAGVSRTEAGPCLPAASASRAAGFPRRAGADRPRRADGVQSLLDRAGPRVAGVVAIYPLMKRVTSWPQAALGLAFSWGALMGWSARFGALAAPALLLYAAAFCWTIGYDTIYALQDARDDAIVGIRSTARLFGRHARLGVGAFYLLTALLAQAALLTAGGSSIAEIGWRGVRGHLAWQVSRSRAPARRRR